MADAETKSNWLRANVGRHSFHPMADPKQTIRNPPPIIMRGDGLYVHDLDGRRMLDCQGGLWCVNAGYGRKSINDAIMAQLEKLPYYTNFPGSATAPATELAALLCEITAPEDMAVALFGSGGSDATETAFKIARQYWKLVGEPERTKIISFRGGYHGLHFGGVASCGGDGWRRNYEPMMPGFLNVEFPNIYRPPVDGVSPDQLSDICLGLLEREIRFQSPDTIAAMICEPIQGAGGVNVPPPGFWPGLRRLCDTYGILLIADEVITGLGRSGAMFGVRNFGVKPDIMCLAKGITSGYIPLSATLLNRRLAQAWEAEGPTSVVMHGYTYSGHPVACAAGLASIEIVLDEQLEENAKAVGIYLRDRLVPLMDRHEVIGDIRGQGLMFAVELVKDRHTKEPFGPQDEYPMTVSDACLARGVMLRTIVNKFIISPPLTFQHEHVDLLVTALDEALAAHPFHDGEPR